MKKTKLRIHTWPEKILKKKCEKVEVVDERIRQILSQMYSLMVKDKGVGLAANQVGFALQLIVIEAGKIFKLVNPRINKKQGKLTLREGCLSFPDVEFEVKRAKKVWVSGLNERGEPFDLEAEGVLAVILQHEIDHINGVLFIDRIPFWQRLKIKYKLCPRKKSS